MIGGVSMKLRGVWVIISLCLLLTIGVSEDILANKDHGQESETVVILTSLSMKSEEEVLDTVLEQDSIDELQDIRNEQEKLDVQDTKDTKDTKDTNDAQDSSNQQELSEEQDSQVTQEEKILTLLTFNIHSANDQDGEVALEQIIEEIRETDAQLVGLQEVEHNMPRSNYQDQARLIAEALGYHYYYGENINILGVQYGNALLSRFPIINAENHKLPKKMLEPRGLIEALVDVDGIPYYVYVTHLGLNPVERKLQIQYINEKLTQRDGHSLILGDFNNNPDSEEMQPLNLLMVDSAVALNKSNQYTFPNWKDAPDKRIDRIYVSPQIELKNYEVMPSAVSDHRRVITQIVSKIQAGEGIHNDLANTDIKEASLPVE
jgi:endonuclease/exonuclease/phosphatase family metal-dependent hydrolase